MEHAIRVSPDITVLHIAALESPDADCDDEPLRREWRASVEQPAVRTGLPPQLQHVSSQYRSVVAPVLRAIQDLERRSPGRSVTVVLPERVDGRWWGYLMHTTRERRLRARLLRFGGPHVAVVSVPWQLQQSDPAEAIAEEESPATSQATSTPG